MTEKPYRAVVYLRVEADLTGGSTLEDWVQLIKRVCREVGWSEVNSCYQSSTSFQVISATVQRAADRAHRVINNQPTTGGADEKINTRVTP